MYVHVRVCTFLPTDPSVPGEHRSLYSHTRLGDSVCLQTSSQLHHSMCVEGLLIWTAVQPLQPRYTYPGTPAFNVHIQCTCTLIVHVLHHSNMPACIHVVCMYVHVHFCTLYIHCTCTCTCTCIIMCTCNPLDIHYM